MKQILRALPLAMALGAISALAASWSEPATARRGELDFASRGASLVVISLAGVAVHGIASHALPAGLTASPALPALAVRDCAASPKLARQFGARPLAGAATPRAPAR